ncbi:toll-like receptor 8 [Carettochelys insculpta]|uniref:toll-like receptor 8 n=1 Tax=Carettochelys insculpta TaxID=44489 RepID=UPI003EBE3E05
MAATLYKLLWLLLTVHVESRSFYYPWVSKKVPCTVYVESNSSSIIFDCKHQNLKAVPLEINDNVTCLILSYNYIKKISNVVFQKFRNLTQLYLNHNAINQSMAQPLGLFRNLTKLEKLALSHNHLQEVPKGLSPSITSLELNANKIVSLKNNTFSELKNLKELFMDQNCYYSNPCGKTFEIEDKAFVGLTSLTVLSLSYNNLTRLPRRLPSSLQELYLGFNKITKISQAEFKELTNLHLLDLSRNCPRCYNAPFPCEPCTINSSIQIHDLAFKNLKKLKTLVLTSTSLTSVPAIWFQNNPQLTALHLAFNYLQNEIASGEFLQNLTSLEELDLSFNFEQNVYLKYLNLSQHFSSLVSLKRLYLKGYVFQELCEQHLKPLFTLKKLNILDLGINFIKQMDLTVFQNFNNLTEIYLTDNRISPFVGDKNCRLELVGKEAFPTYCHLALEREYQSSPSVMQNYKKIDHFLFYTLKPQCTSYGKALDMSSNSLTFINPNQFKSFKDIACLNLSSNGISQAFNGTEFNLTNLKYLDLSNNKLDLAYGFAFNEMKLLEVLDLSHNKHYFRLAGVTLRLAFIENLPHLKVLNLSWNAISTLLDRQLISNSLEELVFRGNRLDILWSNEDRRYIQIFKYLSNLAYLDISHNRLLKIPPSIFLSLPPNLTKLFLNNNRLQVFIFANLTTLKYLKLLDLSQNNFGTVDILLQQPLQSLLLRGSRISQIAVDSSNTNGSLLFLDLSHNRLRYMNQSTLSHLQSLKYLNLKGNPIDCTCQNSDFIKWIQSSNIYIPQVATEVNCANPEEQRKKSVVSITLHACISEEVAAILFYISFAIVINIMLIAVTKHLFYWDVWYVYYTCVAKLKGYKSTATDKALYDAYIAYDTQDVAVTDWVVNELRFHLEENGNKRVLLCLEERDWEPGMAVIDNLSQSIHHSRKTIFVLTKRYVKNGNFKTTFYIALQRLMDENIDVIVFILLEPVLQHSQYLRLRRRLSRSSVLDWPKNPHAEGLFWQNLKNAVLTNSVLREDGVYSI